MSTVNIVYTGIAGGLVGAFFKRPAYGFGHGVACGATVYVASMIFGLVGFYASIGFLTVSYIAQMGAITQRQTELDERIGGVARRQL